MQLPAQWNHIQLQDEIGHGSFGVVYEAKDLRDDSLCAIKIIQIPSGDADRYAARKRYGSSIREYFYSVAKAMDTEISILSELKGSPHIVSVQDHALECDEDGEGWNIFIRMELLEELTSINVDESTVLRIGIDICTALEQCHRLGIIHRDIKPSNILIGEDGSFRLSDFGCAKHLEKSGLNSVRGTFSFMAPEMYRGEDIDERMDLFSLGLVLYTLVNRGRLPFLNLEKSLLYFEDEQAALEKRMKGQSLPDPVESSPGLAEIILRACAFSPEQRYSSAEQMRKDLQRLQQGTYRVRHHRKKGRQISYSRKKIVRRTALVSCMALLAVTGLIFLGKYTFNSLNYTRIDVSSEIDGNGILRTDGSENIEEIAALDPSLKNRITKIVFTEEITEVQDSMFADCTVLREVVLPDSVTSIGKEAFSGCSALEKIDLPKGLNSIGSYAFRDCQSLKSVKIPEGISTLPPSLFQGCTALQSFSCSGTLTKLGNCVFYGCKDLREVCDLTGLTELGNSCFYGCSSLQTVVLGDGITTIPSYAFFDCQSLEDITLPKQLQVIGEESFGNCRSLTNIELPQSIIKIFPMAFDGCSSLPSSF